MEVEHCASRSALVEAEACAIEQEQPLYNVQGLKAPASKTAVAERPGPSAEPRPRRRRPDPFDQRLAPPLRRLDVRVFGWLLGRWHGGDRAEPRVRFTLSELGRDIYDRPIGAGERKELQASLHRLGDAPLHQRDLVVKTPRRRWLVRESRRVRRLSEQLHA